MLNNKNLLAGAFYSCFGGAFALLSLNYPVGTAGRMGPGYFPLVVGLLLVAIGVILIVGSLVSGEEDRLPPFRVSAFVYVIAAVIAFGLTLEAGGLFIATVLLVTISSFADQERSWRGVGLVSVGLTAVGWLVFGRLLALPLELLPPMLANRIL